VLYERRWKIVVKNGLSFETQLKSLVSYPMLQHALSSGGCQSGRLELAPFIMRGSLTIPDIE